jgi:hypothetical protein
MGNYLDVRRRSHFVSAAACVAVAVLSLQGGITQAARVASERVAGPTAGSWQQACARNAPKAGARVYVGLRNDLAALARSRAPGTTFCIEKGVHRQAAPIVPKTDDAFVGEPGAVLSGARSIGALFTRSGRDWVAANQNAENTALDGECASGTACRYPNDVFLDDVPLQRVLDASSVGPGRFY